MDKKHFLKLFHRFEFGFGLKFKPKGRSKAFGKRQKSVKLCCSNDGFSNSSAGIFFPILFLTSLSVSLCTSA